MTLAPETKAAFRAAVREVMAINETNGARTVYVFLMRRPQDREAWPVVYQDRELAEKAFGRVSPVVAVQLKESPDETKA